MKNPVRLSTLRSLSEHERDAVINDLMQAALAAPNGEIEEVSQQITVFEERLGVRAATLHSDLDQGLCQETWDICQLLMLINLRDQLLQARAPSYPPPT